MSSLKAQTADHEAMLRTEVDADSQEHVRVRRIAEVIGEHAVEVAFARRREPRDAAVGKRAARQHRRIERAQAELVRERGRLARLDHHSPLSASP